MDSVSHQTRLRKGKMTPLGKQHFAYLVKQLNEVHFHWADSSPKEVRLTFYGHGTSGNELVMPILQAREYWNTMITRLGYTKGIECSTHLTK